MHYINVLLTYLLTYYYQYQLVSDVCTHLMHTTTTTLLSGDVLTHKRCVLVVSSKGNGIMRWKVYITTVAH